MRFSPATFFVICKSRKTHKEVAWKPWAPPVMASTATSGLPVPVPIDGACRVLIGSWVTPPTTGAIEIERGVDKNITINHGCGGGHCGGSCNSDGNSDGNSDCNDGGSSGGDGSDGGGRESDGSVGGGRSSSPSMVAATAAAKT